MLVYAHLPYTVHTGTTATIFAVIVTIYFWWENIKGIPESSHKALKIMQFTTVMVIVLIAWCLYTVFQRHAQLPPFPWPSNITFGRQLVGLALWKPNCKR